MEGTTGEKRMQPLPPPVRAEGCVTIHPVDDQNLAS